MHHQPLVTGYTTQTFETKLDKDLKRLQRATKFLTFRVLYDEIRDSINAWKIDQTLIKTNIDAATKVKLEETRQAKIAGYYLRLETIDQNTGRALAQVHLIELQEKIAGATQRNDELYQAALTAMDIIFEKTQEMYNFQEDLGRQTSVFGYMRIKYTGLKVPMDYTPGVPFMTAREFTLAKNHDGKPWEVLRKIILEKAFSMHSPGTTLDASAPKQYAPFNPADFGLEL